MCHLLQEDCSVSNFSTGLLASKACCFSSSEADCGVCRGHRTVEFQLFLVIGFCLRFYDSRNLWRKTLPLSAKEQAHVDEMARLLLNHVDHPHPRPADLRNSWGTLLDIDEWTETSSAYVSTCCAPTVALCACGCMFVEVKMKCTGCALQPYMVLALDPVLCTGKLSIVLPFCELVKHAQVSWPMISRLIFRQVGGCLIWQVTWWSLTTSRTVPQTRRKHLTNKSCQFWLGRWTTRHFESWSAEGFGGTSK